jgi:prephenate dehydratase
MSLAAIQGVRGSYSEDATFRILGANTDILECADFEETFQAIASRKAEYAVVPVRNKIVGEIEATVALMKANRFRVLDELPLQVKHVLVGTPDANFENLRTVRSHVEALKQCKRFLSGYPQITQVIGADTASSVRRIVEGAKAENAAIGSVRAAEIYGAKIIREDVADDLENWTTFYLLGN